MTLDDLDEFFDRYLICMLWSSTDQSREDGGDPMDQNYGPEDIDPVCLEVMKEECALFITENAADLEHLTPEQAGHDLWLTRCGHGTGFWDRDLGEVGDRLSDACGWGTKFGEAWPYVGDDGIIYVSPYENGSRPWLDHVHR